MVSPLFIVMATVLTVVTTASGGLIPVQLGNQQRAPGTYYFGTEKVTWFVAQGYCQEAGLKLLVIESSAEQNLVNSFFRSNNFELGQSWIGGVDFDSPGIYYWNPIATQSFPMKYQNFYQEMCVTAGGAVTISNEPAYLGKWFITSLNDERNYFCEA